MSLGIVSNEDFDSELSNSSRDHRPSNNDRRAPEIMDAEESNQPIIDSSQLPEIKEHHPHGRNMDDVNVPQSMRKLIGDTAIFEGRRAGLQLASSLGISSSSVSSYTNPNNSALSDSNKDDITSFLTGRKNKITKRAINKLGLAISLIDETKLQEMDARGLSGVAKDMAQVVKHMEPPVKEAETKEPVQFLMYAPVINTENKYQTVIAKDNY